LKSSCVVLSARNANWKGRMAKAPLKTDRHQVDKFRELECDDGEARFDEKLKKLATTVPKPKPPKPGT